MTLGRIASLGRSFPIYQARTITSPPVTHFEVVKKEFSKKEQRYTKPRLENKAILGRMMNC